jgi:hypothetical protein
MNCYSTGHISGDEHTGGLIGHNSFENVIASFWDIETSGLEISAGGSGKTTVELQTAITFAEWANDSVWTIDEGNDYPRLWWEKMPGEPLLTGFYWGGDGTETNPFLIYTADELNMIGASPWDWNKHFKLMANIDLSTYKNEDFNIIGINSNNPFSGVFDGNGHAISNFNFTSKDFVFIGFFGYVSGENAYIRNLGLIDPNIDNGGRIYVPSRGSSPTESYVGSLVGYLQEGTVTGCYVLDANVLGDRQVGGLIGTNKGTIINCYASSNVIGNENIGGLVGYNWRKITDSHSTGYVSGNWNTGGLIGSNGGVNSLGIPFANVLVSNCYASAYVSYKNIGSGNYIGGLVGLNVGEITSSYARGDVAGVLSAGGLIGDNWFHGSVTNCYATGSVSGGNLSIGGLIGHNEGTIKNCYSNGMVDGDRSGIGGLIGAGINKYVENSFWDIVTSGQTSSDGGIGKTTDEMQKASTFLEAGWDFVSETANGTEDIWWIDEGQDYPRLWWERMVWFADYAPLDPNEYGIKTFEWIYGQTGEYTRRIGESETVPYLSGPITGVQIIENNNTLVGTNDGLNVSFLASGEWFLSTDPNLTAHPPVWSFAGLYNGMIIDQGIWYLVKKDMSEWEVVDNQQLLIDIQDIIVPEGHHNNAVVFWYLDTTYSFTPLDFHGKEFDMGITLPSSSQAAGYSVTEFDIYAVNTGLIAHGDIDAATGSMNDIAVLKQVE